MRATVRPDRVRVRQARVLRVTEDDCEVRIAGGRIRARFAPSFPTPRTDRVSPGHLVAVATAPGSSQVVVWRWYDAVVLGAPSGGQVTLWEPGHGEVSARLRDGVELGAPGSRAYASAGLPGADWWVCGPVTTEPEDAVTDLEAVISLYTDRQLWSAALG